MHAQVEQGQSIWFIDVASIPLAGGPAIIDKRFNMYHPGFITMLNVMIPFYSQENKKHPIEVALTMTRSIKLPI